MKQLISPWISHAHILALQRVEVFKNDKNNQLQTILYSKPMDRRKYLHATSCQRVIYKTSIPYSLAVRIKRICSIKDNLQAKLLNLESWLIDRGIDPKKITTEILRVKKIDGEILLLKRPKRFDDNIPLF